MHLSRKAPAAGPSSSTQRTPQPESFSQPQVPAAGGPRCRRSPLPEVPAAESPCSRKSLQPEVPAAEGPRCRRSRPCQPAIIPYPRPCRPHGRHRQAPAGTGRHRQAQKKSGAGENPGSAPSEDGLSANWQKSDPCRRHRFESACRGEPHRPEYASTNR